MREAAVLRQKKRKQQQKDSTENEVMCRNRHYIYMIQSYSEHDTNDTFRHTASGLQPCGVLYHRIYFQFEANNFLCMSVRGTKQFFKETDKTYFIQITFALCGHNLSSGMNMSCDTWTLLSSYFWFGTQIEKLSKESLADQTYRRQVR